jgi:acetylserotonin N-methyltransferase
MHAMHSHSALISPLIASAVDLSWARHAVDLGGATGALAIELAKEWRQLKVSILDLVEVVEIAKKSYLAGSEEAAFGRRVDAVVGDFLSEVKEGEEDPIPEGDLYVLSRILHDWSEDRCNFLLKRIYDRIPVTTSEGGGGKYSSSLCESFDGAVLIAETLLNEEKTGPVSAVMQDINMLVQTGGRERSLQEYRYLLEKVGFKNVQGVFTGGYLDVVIAFK